MSSDNTSQALADRRNPRVDCSERQAAMSDNTYLSSLASKCREHRIASRPRQCYREFLTTVFGEPAENALARMYQDMEMSVADIGRWLLEHLGWCVTDRQFYRMLRDSGIEMRDYADRKRLSWKQGKMDCAMAKSRQVNKQAYFIGSSAEKMVRYLLQVSLAALNLPWHVVIGDQMQIILSRYEVDVPVIVVDPLSGFSCRFAVEVDSTFAHGTAEVRSRDRKKDVELRRAGWVVYRVDGDSLHPLRIVPQVVDIATSIIRLSRKAFVESLPRDNEGVSE